MITELKIEGFKSFGYPAETIHLGKLNFLVGANASGKTNLISAMQFIQNAILQNIEYAVNQLGGNAEVQNKRYRQRENPKNIHFSIKIDHPFEFNSPSLSIKGASFYYDIQIDLRSDAEIPKIVSEKFHASLTVNGEEKKDFQLDRNEHEIDFTDLFGEKNNKRPIPSEESTRLAIGAGGFVAIPCLIFLEMIRGWRFFSIAPNIARQSYREGPEADLGEGGENLAVILHKIEKGQNGVDLQAIIENMKGVVPGFETIKSLQLQIENKWAYQIKEENIHGTINPYSASDGTIRLLALLVIINWVTQKSSFIAIEEPENGLHPHLTEHLIRMIQDASENCQFLITTHSPAFLDHLNPEEVLLADKTKGATRIKNASSIHEIDNFKKHFTLGELWVQGTLGGIP
jgi:predicted ATPase